jgi:glycosyltransferase involved in cell wall biosynthesis
MKITPEPQIEERDIRRRPLVSVILPVHNEERHIEAVLQSLLLQETASFDLEIIILDGESTDATREIITRIASDDARVTLMANQQRKTPYAFNLGIQKAKGEYVCIFGAHTVYPASYIAICLEELKIHSAVGCSGLAITRPGDNGMESRLVAWAMSHPFGTSSRSMRTRGAGYSDIVPYAIFLKRALVEVGGYDTHLHRNQDLDLNQKLRGRGYKLYVTDRTSCEYFVSSTLSSLAKYAFKNGYWNFISLRKNPSSMAVRHFVPGAFVLVLFFILLACMFALSAREDERLWLCGPAFLLGAVYCIGSIAAAFGVSLREKSPQPLLLPVVFLLLHVSYGGGTLLALVTNASIPSSDRHRSLKVEEPS